MFCFGFMEEGASGMDQRKPEKPCTDIFGRIDISKCFFVLRRTAAFEADQGKVCDSLGALLPSLHYTVQTWSKHCTLLSPKLADSTCTFGPIFRETSLSSLFFSKETCCLHDIVGQSVGWFVRQSDGPSVRRSTDRSVNQLVSQLVGRSPSAELPGQLKSKKRYTAKVIFEWGGVGQLCPEADYLCCSYTANTCYLLCLLYPHCLPANRYQLQLEI